MNGRGVLCLEAVFEGRCDGLWEVTTGYPKISTRPPETEGCEMNSLIGIREAFKVDCTSSETLSTAQLHSLFENCAGIAFTQHLQAHLFKHISSRLIIHEHTSLDFEQSPLLL